MGVCRKILLLILLLASEAPEARASPGSYLVVERFAEWPLTSSVRPFSRGPIDCRAHLMHATADPDQPGQFQFSDILRVTGENQLSGIELSARSAIDARVQRGDLDPQAGDTLFDKAVNFREVRASQITSVSLLSIASSDHLGPTLSMRGQEYRKDSMLQIIGGQEPTAVSSDGTRITSFQSRPLRWAARHREAWASVADQFQGKKVFELSLGASLEIGAIDPALQLSTWLMLREVLTYESLERIHASSEFLDEVPVFVKTGNPAATRLFSRPRYQFQNLNLPHLPEGHAVLKITLGDLLRRFPVETQIPGIRQGMSQTEISSPYAYMKLTENFLDYRRSFYESGGGQEAAIVEIQDRTVIALSKVLQNNPMREKLLGLYALSREDTLESLTSYEKAVMESVEMPSLTEPRVWWQPRKCGGSASSDCSPEERLELLFKVAHLFKREFRDFFISRGSKPGMSKEDYERLRDIALEQLSRVSFLSLSPVVPPGFRLLGKGIQTHVIAVSWDEVVKLQQQYPEIAERALTQHLRVSPLEFKKRLLSPAIDGKIQL